MDYKNNEFSPHSQDFKTTMLQLCCPDLLRHRLTSLFVANFDFLQRLIIFAVGLSNQSLFQPIMQTIKAMKTIGFVRSHKENEHRIAILPEDLNTVRNLGNIYIEEGYANEFGIPDEAYSSKGVKIADRDTVLAQDIICDPKIGDAEYLDCLNNQTLFGWVHAVQNKDITDKIITGGNTAIVWEDMYEKGRHVFWRNNEIAGEAAIMHAYLLHGIFPYNTKVAVLGRGNTARGAIKTLHFLGAEVYAYDRKTEALFREELGKYDVIVNAILWDTSREDHIIYRDDLKRMKPGAMIIDISCDRAGAVETSIPTSIEHPDYLVDGIRHYVVDHTPSLFYKSTSAEISREVARFIDTLIEDKAEECEILKDAIALKDGKIVDHRIIDFQGRRQTTPPRFTIFLIYNILHHVNLGNHISNFAINASC